MKQILAPLLRRTLGEYLEVAEHELEISGQLSLSTVQLRKRQTGPLQVSGRLGQISAKWSWSELLKQPIVLDLHDAAIQLHLPDQQGDSAETPQVAEPQPGFVGRLKRRLMDHLDLTVSNCHISLEGFEGLAGCGFKRLSVSAVRSGEQAVELEGFEMYLAPKDAVSPTAFIKASPRGRARRFGGRRFVDLRGLDLQLDLQNVRVAWTHAQAAVLMALLREFHRLQDLNKFTDCHSDFEYLECEEKPVSAWPSWLRSWGVWGAPEQVEISELPPELRETMEESPVGRADLTVAVAMPCLDITIDDSLTVEVGAQTCFRLHEHDVWDLELNVSRLAFFESAVPLGGMTGADEILLRADASNSALSVESPQLELRITPALVRSVLWAQHAMPTSAPVEANPWHLKLHLPVAIEVAKPWHSQQLKLQGLLVCNSNVDCSMLASLRLNGRELVEELALSIQWKEKLEVVAERICCQCDIRDLVAMARVSKAIFNFGDVCRGMPSVVGSVGMAISVGNLEMSISDRDLDLQSELCCHGLAVRLTELAVVSANVLGLHVSVAQQEYGSLHLDNPEANVNWQDEFQVHLTSGVFCRDPEFEETAISCTSLTCMFLEQVRDGQSGTILIDCNLSSISLRTTETFLQRCRLACEYIGDHALAALFIEPVLLEERPFGLSIEAKAIVATPQVAAAGLAGATVHGMEPPAGDLLEELQSREVPVTILLQPPSKRAYFTVRLRPIDVEAVHFSVQRGMKASLAETNICFKEFQQSFEGSWPELIRKVAGHYLAQAVAALPKLFCNLTLAEFSLFDSTISSAGTSLALLRFGGAAIAQGALAGTLAKAAAAAASSSVEKGRKLRGDDKYKFGDFSRGLIAQAWERGAHGTASAAATHASETSAASSTVGATAGGMLLAGLGPVGVTAGMMGGAAAGRRVSETMARRASTVRESIAQIAAEGREAREAWEAREPVEHSADQDMSAPTAGAAASSGGYRFGDFSRGLLRAGRESRGGEEGYKFGDLTVGAWSKLRR